MFPQIPSLIRPEPRWRATFRSGWLLDYILFGECSETTEVYHWRWAAERAARRHTFATVKGVMRDAFVEPYVPGTNVVPLRARSIGLREGAVRQTC